MAIMKSFEIIRFDFYPLETSENSNFQKKALKIHGEKKVRAGIWTSTKFLSLGERTNKQYIRF